VPKLNKQIQLFATKLDMLCKGKLDNNKKIANKLGKGAFFEFFFAT